MKNKEPDYGIDSISVCMATYNGEKFIKQQIESILQQLKSNDELIIVDDYSNDNTVQIIQGFNDDRIKLYQNDINRKHVFTFGKAIAIAKNDLIFLSDQDDIWEMNRIEVFKGYFRKTDALLISSNFFIFDENTHKEFNHPLKKNDSNKNFWNIVGILVGKRAYFGCAMSFRKELKEIILPIPEYVESHDLWIAIAANLLHSNLHIEEITLSRRIHDNNVSDPNRSVSKKIKTRFHFMFRAIKELNTKIKKINNRIATI